MQELDIKRGHWKNVDLAALFDEHFGSHETIKDDDGEWFVASGPALKSFRARMKDKATLVLDIEEDRSASTDEAMKAIKIKNTLLQAATGFTAKQRAKRAQEAAKKAA